MAQLFIDDESGSRGRQPHGSRVIIERLRREFPAELSLIGRINAHEAIALAMEIAIHNGPGRPWFVIISIYSEVSNLDNINSPVTRMNVGCAVVQIADF